MDYRDKADEGNSSAHHTGRPCINRGCDNPAGTYWSVLWCYEHNVERMDLVNDRLVGPAPGTQDD